MKFFIFVILITSWATEGLGINPKRIPFDASARKMVEIFNENGTSNLRSAIQSLDDRFFKDNGYALVYQSRSAKKASFAKPGIIFFGKDAKLSLAINHHHNNKPDMDVAQWDDDSEEWTLHRVTFAKGKATLSKPNPRECLSCHGLTRTRLNWDTYSIWTGFYGSSHLSLPTDMEIEGWRQFTQNIETDEIYSRFQFETGRSFYSIIRSLADSLPMF